ncbi:MAG: PilN domain-containing protein [Planctomycetota bacterium]
MNAYMNAVTTDLVGRELLRLRLRQWGAIWGIAMVIIAGGSAWLAKPQDSNGSTRLDAERRERARLDTLQERLEKAQAKLDELRKQEGLVLELGNQPPHLMALWGVSTAAAQSGGPVQVESLVLQRGYTKHASPAANGRTRRQTSRIVTLKGTAGDSQTVACFASALRDSGAFSTVELKSTEVDTRETRVAVRYVLDCLF